MTRQSTSDVPLLGDSGSNRQNDPLNRPSLHWILRVGLACCFIGHGSLGLAGTAAWTPYFAVVGIGKEHALALMPWIGAVDVALGLSVLFAPLRSVIFYMAVWAVWTALLRPLAGESFWEAVERAGNYGVPFALFLLLGQESSLKVWLRGRDRKVVRLSRVQLAGWVLRLTTVLLLLGHGMLNWMVQKPVFAAQYDLINLPGAAVEPMIGGFECLLALAVLLKPDYRLLFGVVVWKLVTEALNPMAGSTIWVFVEHGGSYCAPLALAALALHWRKNFTYTSDPVYPATN